MKDVFLDTDPGIDDAMALIYLASCPSVNIRAISTVMGNASLDNCTANALFLKEKFRLTAPIYRGASLCIDGKEPHSFPDHVHGKNGLGDNIWVGLATAVSDAEAGTLTETTFTNYTRKQITASNWTLDSATENEQQAKNSANIEWSASGTDANVTITHVFIASASTSGNIYFVGALDAPKTLALGDIFRINAENLIVEMK